MTSLRLTTHSSYHHGHFRYFGLDVAVDVVALIWAVVTGVSAEEGLPGMVNGWGLSTGEDNTMMIVSILLGIVYRLLTVGERATPSHASGVPVTPYRRGVDRNWC